MKKISLAILFITLTIIIALTTYTLFHQEIAGSEAVMKIKSIEKATSNMTLNELSETYNIELNQKRHKLKSVYFLDSANENTLNLTLYLDGFEILNMNLESNMNVDTMEEVFDEEKINYSQINEEDIFIMKTDQDYLLIKISSNINSLKEQYFVWNDKRKEIIKNVLLYDEDKKYESTTKEDLTMFYDEERQVLAKFEDNKIYALEEKETEESLVLEEYIYTINKSEAQKELINTYEIKKAPKGS